MLDFPSLLFFFSFNPFYFQCLEEEFQQQLEEQERHYGHYLIAALAAETIDLAKVSLLARLNVKRLSVSDP